MELSGANTISYLLIWHSIIQENSDGERNKAIKEVQTAGRNPWLRFVIMAGIIAAIIILSFFYPTVSLIFFIGLPVISSLFNLIFDEQKNRKGMLLNKPDNINLSNERKSQWVLSLLTRRIGERI